MRTRGYDLATFSHSFFTPQIVMHSCQQANLIPWQSTKFLPPTAGCSKSNLLLMFMLLKAFMVYGPSLCSLFSRIYKDQYCLIWDPLLKIATPSRATKEEKCCTQWLGFIGLVVCCQCKYLKVHFVHILLFKSICYS